MGFFIGLRDSYRDARMKHFLEHASGCLLPQLRTAELRIGDDPTFFARSRDGFVLGYIFGSCLSVTENMRFNSKHTDEAFRRVFVEIFGDSGPDLLKRSIRIFNVTHSLDQQFERDGFSEGLKAAKSAGADDDFSFRVGLFYGAGETEDALLHKVYPSRLRSFLITGKLPAN